VDKKFLIRLLAVASNFIWEVLIAIVIGFFLGRWLDGIFDTNRIFMIVFMVVGALAAVRNFMVRVYRLGEKNDE